jgi:hypothetical protein
MCGNGTLSANERYPFKRIFAKEFFLSQPDFSSSLMDTDICIAGHNVLTFTSETADAV